MPPPHVLWWVIWILDCGLDDNNNGNAGVPGGDHDCGRGWGCSVHLLSHGRDHLCCYLDLSQLLRVFVKVVTHGFVEVGDHGDHDCGRGCVAHLLSWEGSTLQQLFISSKKHFSSCPKLLNNYELSGHWCFTKISWLSSTKIWKQHQTSPSSKLPALLSILVVYVSRFFCS